MRGLDLEDLTSRAEAELALSQAVPDPVVRGFLLQNLRRHREADRGGPGWYWQPNLEVIGERLDAITGWPAQELAGVAPYDGPVLWVRGERSDYVADEHVAAMAALFPKMRKVTVKGSGHWVHSEQPEAFASVMRAFLGD
jgi:pimeloyl-ACP methyl ester carboxylesterase